jgi:hypothetical protein
LEKKMAGGDATKEKKKGRAIDDGNGRAADVRGRADAADLEIAV